jgi:hypothetical protein
MFLPRRSIARFAFGALLARRCNVPGEARHLMGRTKVVS